MVPKLILGGSIENAACYTLQPVAREDMPRADDGVQAFEGDRVAALCGVNLGFAVNDRESATQAWQTMTETVENAEQLKRAAGIPLTGRKPALIAAHLILSWDRDQAPEPGAMFSVGCDALGAIGMRDRQALMVVHADRDHSHLHIVANRVSPTDGRLAPLSHDRLALSRWAEAYERAEGDIRCAQRVENNHRRDLGERVRYRQPAAEIIDLAERRAKAGRPDPRLWGIIVRDRVHQDLWTATSRAEADARLAAHGLHIMAAPRGGHLVTDGIFQAKLSTIAASLPKLTQAWSENQERALAVPGIGQQPGSALDAEPGRPNEAAVGPTGDRPAPDRARSSRDPAGNRTPDQGFEPRDGCHEAVGPGCSSAYHPRHLPGGGRPGK